MTPKNTGIVEHFNKFSCEMEMADKISEYLNACSAEDLLKLYAHIFGEDDMWRKAVVEIETGVSA